MITIAIITIIIITTITITIITIITITTIINIDITTISNIITKQVVINFFFLGHTSWLCFSNLIKTLFRFSNYRVAADPCADYLSNPMFDR